MKSRNFLPLIEQIIMIAVFATVSTVCISCFSLARSISIETEQTDNAVILAQNTAEELKIRKELTEKTIKHYTENLIQTDEISEYTVISEPIAVTGTLLGGANIEVFHREKELFGITVYWQEELPDE